MPGGKRKRGPRSHPVVRRTATGLATAGPLPATATTMDEPGITLRFRPASTGKRTGTETAQAYLRPPAGVGEPAPRLAAWKRVTLKPGRTRTAPVHLDRHTVTTRRLTAYRDA